MKQSPSRKRGQMQRERPERVVSVVQDVEAIKAEQEQAKRDRIAQQVTGR